MVKRLTTRFFHLWWWTSYLPALLISSPILLPYLFLKNIRFKKRIQSSIIQRNEQINAVIPLELDDIDYLSLNIIVDFYCKEGYKGNPAVSYYLETNKGSLLIDIGFGNQTPVLSFNATKMGLSGEKIDRFLISHLHSDHAGGRSGMEGKKILLPDIIKSNNRKKPLYVPEMCTSEDLKIIVASKPMIIGSGFATTGPLRRELFYLNKIDEQAVIAKIKNKGIVIITGCGHPTIEVIVQMVMKIIPNEPIYAIIGGLHFPISESRGKIWGIPFQQVLGTGKTFAKKITLKDLSKTIDFLNSIKVEKLLLSAHDSCDKAIKLFEEGVEAKFTVLRAGNTYII